MPRVETWGPKMKRKVNKDVKPRKARPQVSQMHVCFKLEYPKMHVGLDRIVCGAPDRRSPLAALAQPPSDTTHVSVTPPYPLLVLIQSPSPLLPPTPSSPLPHFIPARAFKTLSTTPSVSFPCPPPTLVLSFTVPHCAPSVRHPSSRPV